MRFKRPTLFGVSLLVGAVSFIICGLLGAGSVVLGVMDKMDAGFDMYLIGMSVLMFGLVISLAIAVLDWCREDGDR